jgi:hypothetical protein
MTSTNCGVLHSAAAFTFPRNFGENIFNYDDNDETKKQQAEKIRKEICDKVIQRQIKVLNYLLFGNAKSRSFLNINCSAPFTPLFTVIRNNGDSCLALVKWLVEVAGAEHNTSRCSGANGKIKFANFGELAALTKQIEIAKYLGYDVSILTGIKKAFASLVK